MNELSQRKIEFRHVLPGQLVPLRDAHGAGFAVQAIGEAQRARTAADVPVLRFQDRDAMAAALELVRGNEACKSGADDDDVQRRSGIGNGRQCRQRIGRGCSAGHGHQSAQEFPPRERVRNA